MYKTIGEMFFYSLQKYSQKIFQYLDDTNEKTTYSELLEWSVRTAINLKEEGITRNDVISSCTYNHKYSCVPFIASQFLGAKCCNFDFRFSETDTIHLLQLIEPKVLFVSEESSNFIETCLDKANVKTKLVVYGQSEKHKQFTEYLKSSNDEKNFKPTKVEDDTDVAMILFSSGTTGFPKGICLNHRALLTAASKYLYLNNTKSDDLLVLMHSPLYWITAIRYLMEVVLSGSAFVIRVEFDPVYTWTLLQKYKVTDLFLAPYNAIDFVKQRPDNAEASSLNTFLTGGCAVPVKLMEDLKEVFPSRVKILLVYGQTETAGIITTFSMYDPSEYNLQALKPQSCGKMIEGIQWKVTDPESGKILGPYEHGELRIKYDKCILNGYYKMDSSFIFDTDGYYKTGDIVYFDEEKCFYVVDRFKEIFKYKWWHIHPSSLEVILLSHPAVKEAVVIGIPHETDGEVPMGIVVLFKGYDSTAKDIQTFVDERISVDGQKLRAGVVIVDAIPKTPSGKIRRSDVRSIFLKKLKN